MNILHKIKSVIRGVPDRGFDYYMNIEGWLTPVEANGLYEIAKSLSVNATVVEIGSWKGKSTYCISKGLKKATLYCIDPFNAAGEEGSREIYEKTKGERSLLDQFKENLSEVNNNVKIEVRKGYSNEFVDSISDIDFLFIDGDHSIEGCRYDYEHYSRHIKAGGFLAFHDYDPQRKDLGPTWVIENLVIPSPNFKFYKSFDSLWVAKRI